MSRRLQGGVFSAVRWFLGMDIRYHDNSVSGQCACAENGQWVEGGLCVKG